MDYMEAISHYAQFMSYLASLPPWTWCYGQGRSDVRRPSGSKIESPTSLAWL